MGNGAVPQGRIRSRRTTKVVARIAISALGIGALVLPSNARAEQVVDQQQTAFNEIDAPITVVEMAQTFTAGLNGRLPRVDLLLRAGSQTDCSVEIQLRDTSAGEPGNTVLASTTVNGASLPTTLNFVPVTFPFPATVAAGTQYALTLDPACFEPVDWAFNTFEAYIGGAGFTRIGPSGRFGSDGRDFAFRTYVVLPSPVLVSPANGSTTTDATPLFSGTADTSGTADLTEVSIEIFEGASTSGPLFLELIADPDDVNGAFGVSPSVPLPDGTYVAQVVQDNSFGQFGRSNANVFAVDSTGTSTGIGIPGTPGVPGTGPGAGTGTNTEDPPDTTITSPLFDETRDKTPTLSFVSSQSPMLFECSVDGGAFVACASPFTLPQLSRGDHSFLVRALDLDGNIDPTPARADFKVKKKQKKNR